MWSGDDRDGGISIKYGPGISHPALLYCSDQIGKNLVWFLINRIWSGHNLE